MFIAPYSIIAFHGIANEQAAVTTGMTDQDFSDLKQAIWNGTKNLITRSKFEQLPRILVDIVFKEGEKTHIGELDKYVKLISNQGDKTINDISDVVFDFAEFVKRTEKFADRIEKIAIKIDQRVQVKNLESSKISLTIDII
jgi:CRISPR-associated protein Csh2